MFNKNIHYYDSKYNKLKRVNSDRKVVVTMTTVPSRINDCKETLISILDSSRKVDEICINIPYKTSKGEKYKIPKWLEKLKNVKIYRVCKDFGPSTKLLPTLKREEKDTIIIVIDDDVIYGPKMIEKFIDVFYSRKCKDAITTFGADINKHLKILNSYNALNFKEFKEWVKQTNKEWLKYLFYKKQEPLLFKLLRKTQNIILSILKKIYR